MSVKVVTGPGWTLKVLGPDVITESGTNASAEILTRECLQFVGTLCHAHESVRQSLLQQRCVRAMALDAGELPQFGASPLSAAASEPHWKCAAVPDDIKDRRVEITGPVDRKMVINGLNSGASVYMADFEDSTSPTWHNLIDGQVNLKDAVRKTISYVNPANRKTYQLNEKTCVLMVRPRGFHLNEAHVTVNDVPISGSIFDFAVFLFHNHVALATAGTRPYFYLPKLEAATEASLWNAIFCSAQDYLGLPRGTVRATVLLETITAAYEMEEILFALRHHMLGLNCGRWDYLFSFIKKFKMHTDKITPDRHFLTMTDTPLLVSYVQRLITICHSRGTFAMGGMSAAIPVKDDAAKNQAAMEAVRRDKIREVTAGHDGTWVAHPALVTVARQVFHQYLPDSNRFVAVASLHSGIETCHVCRLAQRCWYCLGVYGSLAAGGRMYSVAWSHGRCGHCRNFKGPNLVVAISSSSDGRQSTSDLQRTHRAICESAGTRAIEQSQRPQQVASCGSIGDENVDRGVAG
jgi:malate synthase